MENGSRTSPATTTETPKPYPVEVGACTYRVTIGSSMYIPSPANSPVVFAVRTARLRIRCRLTSGI